MVLARRPAVIPPVYQLVQRLVDQAAIQPMIRAICSCVDLALANRRARRCLVESGLALAAPHLLKL
jgi:hypothetical protein